jgi:hypothetical protein
VDDNFQDGVKFQTMAIDRITSLVAESFPVRCPTGSACRRPSEAAPGATFRCVALSVSLRGASVIALGTSGSPGIAGAGRVVRHACHRARRSRTPRGEEVMGSNGHQHTDEERFAL